jgi:peptide/nickel transport system substrate-binding protein
MIWTAGARRQHAALLVLGWVVILSSCGPSEAAPGGAAPGGAVARGPRDQVPKKRLVAGIFSDPEGFQRNLTNPGGGGGTRAAGLIETENLVHAALVYMDEDNVLRPRLAEAVPSTENGLWKVFPDGRMETTWALKRGVRWHDGVPFTAADVLFAVELNLNPPMLGLVEAVHAPDDFTVVVTWKGPFVDADTLFGAGLTGGNMIAIPRPRHILAAALAADKSAFLGLPYWREAYVGVGPYRLREWVPSSHILLIANDASFVDMPKIDEIEIKLFTDINGVITSLLAGTISLPIGGGLNIAQYLQIRDHNPQIRMVVGDRLGAVVPLYPQFVNPDPAIIDHLEFRRALLMALDRQELNDTLNFGVGTVAYSWLQTDRPEYPAVASQIVSHPYNPRRAAEILQELGLTRGPDGVLASAAGERMAPGLGTTEQAQHRMAIFPIADTWKTFGVDTQPYIIPNQRLPDREYVVTFPGFFLVAVPVDPSFTTIQGFRSTSTPLASNGYQGGNRARYMNPAFDELLDRYLVTIPTKERLVALGGLLRHQTEQLTMLPLFYQATANILGDSHLRNGNGLAVWDAHNWEMD